MAGGGAQPQPRARARARARGCFGRGQALENTWKGLGAPRCGAVPGPEGGDVAPALGLGCRGPAPSGPTQNSSSAILPGALLRGCGARCGLLLGVLARCTPRGVAPAQHRLCAGSGPSSLHQDAKARRSRSEDRGHAPDLEPVPRPPDPRRAEAASFPPCPGAGSTYLHRRACPQAAQAQPHSPPACPSCKRPAPQFRQLWLRPATTAHPEQQSKQESGRASDSSEQGAGGGAARTAVAVETTACDPGLDASLLHPSTSPLRRGPTLPLHSPGARPGSPWTKGRPG